MIRPLFRIPVAAAVVALLAAGCASANGSAAPTGLEQTNLVVAAVPAADAAGVFIAEQDGLFSAEGLHVKIDLAVSSADVITNQMEGKYDVTMGAYPSYISADAKQHADLEILAAGSIMQPRNQVLMIPPDSPIRSIAQLKGKTIAVNASQNIVQLLVSALLADNGMSYKTVHFRIIPFPNMAQALRTHQVAAAAMPEPFVTAAEEQVGAQPLADEDVGAAQNLPIAGYVVTKKWAQKNPRTAAAFLKALDEAQRIADTNPKAVEKALEKYSGVNATEAAVMAVPSFPLNTDTVLIQRVADLMKQYGYLPPQGYDVGQIIFHP